MTMTKTEGLVKIWVGSLKDYSEGRLVGEWLELPMDQDELDEFMNRITYNGKHDYKIFDYEAPFRVDEWDSPWALNEQAEKLEELMYENNISEDELEVLLEYCDNLEEAIELLESGSVHFYHLDNTWDGWKELAEMLVIDYGWLDVPEHLIDYIDYERLGYSLKCEGNWCIKDGVAVQVIW